VTNPGCKIRLCNGWICENHPNLAWSDDKGCRQFGEVQRRRRGQLRQRCRRQCVGADPGVQILVLKSFGQSSGDPSSNPMGVSWSCV
jgi:hypothetical protein